MQKFTKSPHKSGCNILGLQNTTLKFLHNVHTNTALEVCKYWFVLRTEEWVDLIIQLAEPK